jgi:hypothetical protein
MKKNIMIDRCMPDFTSQGQTLPAILGVADRRLTEIIEFLPDAVFMINQRGEVTAWNRAMAEMTGALSESMIGRGNYAHAVPFYGKPRPMLADLVMRPGKEWAGRYEIVAWRNNRVFAETPVPNLKGGKGAYLWAIASTLFDDAEEVIGAIEIIRDMDERKHLESSLHRKEKELEKMGRRLEETNTALKVLWGRREEDRKELQESIVYNVKKIILPCIERLNNSRLDDHQKAHLGIIKSSVQKIVSPFLKNFSQKFNNLTPMEIQIAGLIRDGKTSKEIADILCLSEKTILTHRYNLRTKLGLRGAKLNLRSYLLSLE